MMSLWDALRMNMMISYQELVRTFLSKKEAEALVSMDLGHGDGRGHYVARVYNKGEPHDD
ncbi:hypothetical protein B0X03_15760 [Klebsiella pneumoniae subsp. pneumoniae]|nr:hypothetical protein B0X03_15760 [Klebsiella pneumoniae subsp. pneumoniae]